MLNEIWKPVVGFEGLYEVSNLGRIKSLWWKNEKLLKNYLNQGGYFAVSLHHPYKKTTHRVNRLVAAAFHGPCPDGFQCAHLDGNKQNNVPNNLIWCSVSENQSHKKLHGTHLYGETSPVAKLTEKEVLEIREKYARGIPPLDMLENYEIGRCQMYLICAGKTWKHLI